MDFVPGPSTASYERYVSESDTDGEGDVSLRQRPQQRRPQNRMLPALAPKSPGALAGEGSILLRKGGEGMAGDDFILARGGGDSCGGRGSSILSRLKSSWKSTARGGPSVEELHCYRLHKDGEGGVSGASGTPRKNAQEGQPTTRTKIAEAEALDGDNRGEPVDGGVSRRNGLRGAFDGLSRGSSSGLKGLQGSLLTNEEFDGDAGGSGGENTVGGVGGRGVWEEASRGDLEALAKTLAPGGGGDVQACAVDGWTALHAAAHAGHTASVSLLIRSGASTAARAKRGWTPLHSACMRGRWQAARALLAAGADANARAVDQRTPLHFACEAGSPECAKELLRAGAAANVSDQDARTPLHFACIDGSTECVRRLLAAGASPLPPDAWGRDPAAVARQLNRSGPLRLLEAAAASGGARKLVASGDFTSGGVTSGAITNGGCDGASPPPPPPLKAGVGPCEGRGGEEEDEDGADVGDGKDDADGGGWSSKGSGGRGGGSRWVVMNESGRMLDRASEKVALFKSMAAAADWANGLKITSGSFQVAEVAPTMRKAFEEEVQFEMTGGDTLSDEEEEEKWDPQWTRFRRQQAAARKEERERETGGVGRRRRRGAWGVAPQRRDEDEARALVVAANDKLREVMEERDMHRERASSLQRALEAVLRDCETAKVATTAAAAASAVESNPAGVKPPLDAPKSGAVPDSRMTRPQSIAGPNVERVTTVAEDPAEPGGAGEGLGASSEISESETDAEVDDDVNDDVTDVFSDDANDCVNGDVEGGDFGAAAETVKTVDERQPGNVENSRRGVPLDKGDSPQQAMMIFVEDAAAGDTSRDSGCGATGTRSVVSAAISNGDGDPSVEAARHVSGARAPGAEALSGGGGVDLLEFDDDDADIDGDDDAAAASQEKKLAAWLSGLEIRRSHAIRYAGNLVADGFDSGEALRGVREDELMQYGMKKGHARLVVRTLSRGLSL